MAAAGDDAARGLLRAQDFRRACEAFAAAWRAHGCAGEWAWRDAGAAASGAAAALAAPEDATSARGWLELRGHLLRAAGSEDEPSGGGGAADGDCGVDDEDDDVALAPSHPERATWHVYTLHVVHNASYGVPQLLLRGADRHSGAPLRWADVLADVARFSVDGAAAAAAATSPATSAPPLGARWTVLTPWEHPHTGEPWLALHPCSTRDWMALLLASHDDHESAAAVAAAAAAAADASAAAAARAAPGAAALGRYMRAWWGVVGAAVGAPLPLAAYMPR